MTETNPYATPELAELYDTAWGSFGDDVQMYEQFARRGESASLELGAGSGRVALHLARAHLQVVGLDSSPAMLTRFRSALDAETEPRVRLVEGDMRSFDLREQFDLIYCAANSFQHLLTTDDQLSALRQVARHLSPGGLYVMQLRTLRAIDWGAERTPLYLRWTRPIDGSSDLLMRFDSTITSPAAQTATTTHCFDRVAPDGNINRRVIEYTLRYTGLPELRLLCVRAGLRIAQTYADADLSPYDDASDTLIVVAEAEES